MMKTKFDQKNFNLILKSTLVLTKITQIIMIIGIASLVLLSLGVLVIPSELYNIDLSEIDAFRMNIGTLDMRIPIESMSGTLNIRYLIIFASATLLVYLGSFLYLFRKVEAFLLHVKKGTPFADENIHMMYHIGKVLVALSVILPVITLPFAWRIAHLLPLDITVNLEINLGLLVLGFVVLLLASIFNYGAYLQEEYDQTV
ncbi:MAG: DUF2975 domain-containing protein [Candidatus Izemoplasmataceae bacterium]